MSDPNISETDAWLVAYFITLHGAREHARDASAVCNFAAEVADGTIVRFKARFGPKVKR